MIDATVASADVSVAALTRLTGEAEAHVHRMIRGSQCLDPCQPVEDSSFTSSGCTQRLLLFRVVIDDHKSSMTLYLALGEPWILCLRYVGCQVCVS